MNNLTLKIWRVFNAKVTFILCLIIVLGHTLVMGEKIKQKPEPPLHPPANLRISSPHKHTSILNYIPEGRNGIATRYPGDKNIENDPDVIFVEKFNEGPHSKILEPLALRKISKRWDTVSAKDIMHLSSNVPKNSADEYSLLLTHVGGKSAGGGLYRQLLPGYEHIFARFYVKFDPDCAPIGHFGARLGGYNPPTAWPQGGAGTRPDGSKLFTTQVDTYGKNWQWDFYTYWQGMHVHGDGRYWGTPFLGGGSKPPVERGKWICVELMVKMNNPVNSSNGEQAFWIDGRLWRRGGQLVSHIGPGFPKGQWTGGWWRSDENSNHSFEGFNWRDIRALAINYLSLQFYMPNVRSGHVSKVWFDNVIVAKKYIGPIQPIQ